MWKYEITSSKKLVIRTVVSAALDHLKRVENGRRLKISLIIFKFYVGIIKFNYSFNIFTHNLFRSSNFVTQICQFKKGLLK